MSYTHTFDRAIRAKSNLDFIQSSGTMSFVPANPAANRTINIPDPGGTDYLLFRDAAQTVSNKTLGTNLAAGGFKVTGLADPSSAQDAATKAYVDSVAQGLSVKESVRVATTANVATLAGGAPDTVDGVTLSTGDRILVKNQSTGSQNGLYTVTTVGSGANGTWARAADFNGASDIPAAGTVFVFVSEGTVNADSGWVLTTNAPYTIGSTSLAWTQFSGSGTAYTEGDGIDITSNVISVVGTSNRISVGPSGVDIAATYVGQSSITTLGTVTTGTWSATTIAINKGGTGQTSASAAFNALSPMTTLGDIIYGDSSGAGTRLAGNTAATKKFLSQTGNGTISAIPAWAALVSGDIPVIALGTVGSAGGISGTLAIGNGGTGQTTAAAALTALGGMPFLSAYALKTNTDYTLVSTDQIIGFSTSNTDRVATLPQATSGNKGQVYVIGKVDSGTGDVVVTPTSCNVNGAATHTIDSQWDFFCYFSDGSNYFIF